MKKFILFIFSMCLGLNAIAQIAYYDAIDLSHHINPTTHQFKNDQTSLIAVSQILKKYYSSLPQETDYHNVIKLITTNVSTNPDYNPFIAPLFGIIPEGISTISANSKSFPSAIGGLEVTNIANGIAQFMIKRAKEELTIAFFERFRKFADENPEFQVLFPKTTNNLENLLSYKYPEYLPVLRVSFFEDIKATPYHLDDVLQLPRYQSLLKDLPEVKVAVRTVQSIYELETGNAHAAELLVKVSDFPEWTESSSSAGFKNFGSAVKLGTIFSQSMRNDSTRSKSRRAWISYSQADSLVSDEVTLKIYLGLVYQLVKNDKIEFYPANNSTSTTAIPFVNIMARQKDNLFLFRNKVTEFIALAEKVDKVTDSVRILSHSNILTIHDAFYDYIDVSLDVMEYAFSIGTLFDERLDFTQYTLLARSANDLYRNIYKQEYTPAINNLVDILEQTKALVDENRIDIPESTVQLLDSLGIKFDVENKKEWKRKNLAAIDNYLKSSSPNASNVESLQDVKSWYYWNQLDSKLLKISQYGLFMANMANAQSPQEVAAIMDNATLPVGSSSIKKNSKTNVAIQSYLGPYVLLDKPENKNAWTSQFGVTAPIGIAFSKGFTTKGGSLSVFISLLDLGAIVDYQLKTETTVDGIDSVHKDYKVELGQIFSPGTYLVYGLPWRLPLSFGIGGQYGPGLGKIEEEAVVNNPSWRWNAFLAVDIPLFNLANTPRKN